MKRYYVNTDNIDIDNKQIGVHFSGAVNREFCIGINHGDTKDSIAWATAIANHVARLLNAYYASEENKK